MNTGWSVLDAATTIISCVVTLFYCFPAYHRTKQIGFVYLGASALGALGNTLSLHILGSDYRHNPEAYLFFHQTYRIMYIVDAIFGIIGTILVVNGYLRIFEARQIELPPPLMQAESPALAGERLTVAGVDPSRDDGPLAPDC